MTSLNRRGLLKLAAGTAIAGLAIAGGQQATATGQRSVAGPDAFDETYQGRRIEGGTTISDHSHHHGTGPVPWVRIDGRDLHVMRKAEGGYVSATNHYDPQPSLRTLARVAVEELNGAQLVELQN